MKVKMNYKKKFISVKTMRSYYVPIRMAKIQNIKNVKYPTGEDMEQWELSFIAAGMQNVTITLQDILAVSYKAKHRLTIPSSNSILVIYPNAFKTQKPTHGYLWQFIHNCQKLEVVRCPSSGEWIDCDPSIWGTIIRQ